jgi:hypothetical protein
MGLMARQNINLTISIRPRDPGPLTIDEQKQLTEFFVAVMDLRPKKEDNQKKETYGMHK